MIEATMANIFIVKSGKVYTPDLSRCGVSGIMRRLVMEYANQLNIFVHVNQLRLSDVLSADEVFLTNSLIGIWPVISIDSTSFQDFSVAQQLTQAIKGVFPV